MTSTKVAIVTGGAKGIGAAIALHLLSQTIRVVVADIHIPDAKFKLCDPSCFLFVKTDVTNESSVKQLVQKTYAHFGRIDSLVNNAGILPDDLPRIEKTSLKLWEMFIRTNLTGPFLCAKYAIPHIRKTKGTIINIASTRALQSEGSDAPYAASKGGLVSLSRAMAIELGPAIRVNAVSPGWIDTGKFHLTKKDHKQHPVGRVGKPQDVAHLVHFLLSEEAAYITGQNYIIDGGMTSKMIYL